MLELFTNAFHHERGEGNLVVHARAEGGHFVFELREPKKTFAALTENWGGQPLLKVGRGHYGLGLHRVRVIVEDHQGQLQARYVSATLFCTRRSRCPCPRSSGVGGSIKCARVMMLSTVAFSSSMTSVRS